jgi:hypothetical protein
MVLPVSHRISPVPRYSGYCSCNKSISHTGLSPYIVALSSALLLCIYSQLVAVLQPRQCRNIVGLGSSPFARHYLGNHFCFLLLRILRCFSSPRLLPFQDNMSSTYWVAPFGYLRIKGYLHLPEAFRSLSRPSSPLRAKASTLRPY